ncbi:centriole, cilia and spindle-associated protein-like [Pimephales promelas]|uniref:centriole, cilia and spindle-associated protein-like n=1 Tax=Pimephales promelas TaxID=90988 RepID=UPI001955ACB6|nr:centriole, cilia and spindle-associated protein-like [Pimephales promelas]
MNFSTSSSESSCGTPMTYTNDKPPFTSHFRKPRVQFLELDSESGGSYSLKMSDSGWTSDYGYTSDSEHTSSAEENRGAGNIRRPRPLPPPPPPPDSPNMPRHLPRRPPPTPPQPQQEDGDAPLPPQQEDGDEVMDMQYLADNEEEEDL